MGNPGKHGLSPPPKDNEPPQKRVKETAPLVSGLKSDRTSLRLQQIASLRSRGIAEHVALPTLVVCGDQSSGKSSCLEALIGLPFPRQDGLCTTFATEICIVHTDSILLVLEASVIPSAHRNESEQAKLKTYSKVLTDFAKLPEIISEVSNLMGVRGVDDDGKVTGTASFVEDILRIKVTGPTGLHLTLVDLPGLIHTASEQQTAKDVGVVHTLVDSYCRNPRTIILAVVQATNDIANQSVIMKSKTFDPQGTRTVGVITKADLINAGTEPRIALLSRNQDTTRLALGWYLLKNPSPSELARGITADERTRNESEFFTSSPWKEQHLNRERVGIERLQSFLQVLLAHHIEKEMPQVRQEIETLLRRSEAELEELGEERTSEHQWRMYLLRVSMKFQALTMEALEGAYDRMHASFFDEQISEVGVRRLSAFIYDISDKFSNDMRLRGHTLDIKTTGTVADGYDLLAAHEQVCVTEKQMFEFVKAVYRRNKGNDLAGMTNQVLLTKLFRHQSRPWRKLAEEYLDTVADGISVFVRIALKYITTDDRVRDAIFDRVEGSLATHRAEANKMLEFFLDMEGRPLITLNHYFVTTIQKGRIDALSTALKHATPSPQPLSVLNHPPPTGPFSTAQPMATFNQPQPPGTQNQLQPEKLIQALAKNMTADMNEQACREARVAAAAYYKTARKTFVDNIARAVIDMHLLRHLPNIFDPEVVGKMSVEELEVIAGEDELKVSKRKDLQVRIEALKASLKDLRK